MKIGIVGHEAAKFTKLGTILAKDIIRELLFPGDRILVSGHCHLGGVDIWAEEIAKKLNRQMIIFPPKQLNWTHYKIRNLNIAAESDIVYSIVVDRYPPGYSGMRFPLCYHCNSKSHIKSGGCWTAKHAKRGEVVVVQNLPECSTARNETSAG
jgi:hypothetical protein